LKAEEIKQYLSELNDELRAMDVKGEVCIYGGAVMCLVFDARPATKDIDAVFRPAQQIRQAAERVAQAHNIRGDWLNDAVKGFVVPHAQRVLFDFSHLKVYVPEPDYLLAMKAIAARVDETDREDAELLIKLLKLKTPDEVFAIVEKYYPRHQIKPATQFFIEEIFGQ
jgi:hypothetical protein